MLRYITLILIAFVFTGCALTEDKIDIPYQERGNITVVQGADKINVEVKNEDKRTVFKNRVGAKKNTETNGLRTTFKRRIPNTSKSWKG
jgi:hypothetical protein